MCRQPLKRPCYSLNNRLNSHEATAWPGACAEDILTKQNIEGEKLKVEDILMIVAASNSIAKNEAKDARDKISEVMK